MRRFIQQAAFAFVALVCGAFPANAVAELDGDRFESLEWKIRLRVPIRWQASTKAGYPSALLRMQRRAPVATLMLSAERVPSSVDSLRYAATTAELLKDFGFDVRAPQLHNATGAYWIDSRNPRAHLRQAFLVRGGIAYSLVLSAPDSRTRARLLRAFDATLRSLEVLSDDQVRRLREERAPDQAAEDADRPPEPCADRTKKKTKTKRPRPQLERPAGSDKDLPLGPPRPAAPGSEPEDGEPEDGEPEDGEPEADEPEDG